MWPGSTRVNSPDNDDSSLLDPDRELSEFPAISGMTLSTGDSIVREGFWREQWIERHLHHPSGGEGITPVPVGHAYQVNALREQTWRLV